MIGRLCGRIEDITEDSVLIDVGGVGYHVFCSARTLASLAEGEVTTLIIDTHVREDHIHLFGFPDSAEREWFRLLTTVQRVGNKVALQILSAYGPAELATAILAKDTTAFSRIKGIGAGLAERIVTELKDKVVSRQSLVASQAKLPSRKKTLTTNDSPLPTDDAISALVNLGYSRSEAYSAALKAAQAGDKNLDDLIRLSLKELART